MNFQNFEDRRLRASSKHPIGRNVRRVFNIPVDFLADNFVPDRGQMLQGWPPSVPTTHVLTEPYVQNVNIQRMQGQAIFQVTIDAIQPEYFVGITATVPTTATYIEVHSSRTPSDNTLPTDTILVLGVATSTSAAQIPKLGDQYPGPVGTSMYYGTTSADCLLNSRCSRVTFETEYVHGLVFIRSEFPAWNFASTSTLT